MLAGNGSVIRERPGRYWLLAPGADRRGARSLAERIAASVAAAGPDETLQTLIGIAVYPADGRQRPRWPRTRTWICSPRAPPRG